MLTAATPQAQSRTTPSADLAASLGWLYLDTRVGRPGDQARWDGTLHGGITAGWYWTDNLKTEIEAGGASEAQGFGNEIVQPPGTAVRVERATGSAVRGTLIKASDTAVFIQPGTRIPEAAVEVPITDILTLTPEAGHGGSIVAKAIAAGVAAGAGAALAVFLVLVSIYD